MPTTTSGVLNLDMKDAKPGQRLYMGISGGLDSAYLAYRLLTMGHPLLLHHCTYRTAQNRWIHEELAFLAVLTWLLEHELDDWTICKSEYTANAVFRSDEAEVIGKQRIEENSILGWNLDYRYLLPEAGKQLHTWRRKNRSSRSDIRHVVIPSHYESRRTFGDPEFESFWDAANSLAGRPLVGLEPMKRYNRTQILSDMPRDLIALCWWCRKPKNGKPCHQCSTCRAVDPALKANGIAV